LDGAYFCRRVNGMAQAQPLLARFLTRRRDWDEPEKEAGLGRKPHPDCQDGHWPLHGRVAWTRLAERRWLAEKRETVWCQEEIWNATKPGLAWADRSVACRCRKRTSGSCQ
jgi:hypothetical protein